MLIASITAQSYPTQQPGSSNTEHGASGFWEYQACAETFLREGRICFLSLGIAATMPMSLYISVSTFEQIQSQGGLNWAPQHGREDRIMVV